MHSRVFVLKTKHTSNEDFIFYEDHIYELMNGWADNVIEYKDQLDNDIKWLDECYGNILNIENRTITINQDGLKEYIETKINKIKQVANKLTLDKTASEKNIRWQLFDLQDAITDKQGFWVITDYAGIQPLDDFLVMVFNDRSPSEWEITQSFDYSI